jgi:hypothetical protein
MTPYEYTHIDKNGMRWRFAGSKPMSELADLIVAEARDQELDKLRSEMRKRLADHFSDRGSRPLRSGNFKGSRLTT